MAAAERGSARQEVVAGMALTCPAHAVFGRRPNEKRSKNRNAGSDVVNIGKTNLSEIVLSDDPEN